MNLVITKVVSLLIMIAISLTAGLLPIKLLNVLRRLKNAEVMLSAAICFGAGILMGTVFLHMIPDIDEDVDEAMKNGLFVSTDYPLSLLIIFGGFFIMYLFDEIVHTCAHRQQHKHDQIEEFDNIAFVSEPTNMLNTNDLVENPSIKIDYGTTDSIFISEPVQRVSTEDSLPSAKTLALRNMLQRNETSEAVGSPIPVMKALAIRNLQRSESFDPECLKPETRMQGSANVVKKTIPLSPNGSIRAYPGSPNISLRAFPQATIAIKKCDSLQLLAPDSRRASIRTLTLKPAIQRCDSVPTVALMTSVCDSRIHTPMGTLRGTPHGFDNHSIVLNMNDTQQNSPEGNEQEEDKGDETIKMFRSILIITALSIHGCLEGMALGLEMSSSDVWLLFTALSSHKAAIGFSIGMELLESGVKLGYYVMYMVIFSIASPFGGLIGALVSTSDTSAGGIVIIILRAFSAGTILFVVFCEILERERNKVRGKFARYIAILLGFSVMACLVMINDKH